MFSYIEETPTLTDIVVSGGDSYLLPAQYLTLIGERLLSIPHIRRFRFATKGLAVCPSRILDKNDPWTDALIALSNKGKKLGKAIAVHTHFNHPNEITWLTRLATQKLFENGVIVRNQSVLLRGVNDDVEVMKRLIRDLADMNVTPVSYPQTKQIPSLTSSTNTSFHKVLRIPRRHGPRRRRTSYSPPNHPRHGKSNPRQHRRLHDATIRSRSSRRRRKETGGFEIEL